MDALEATVAICTYNRARDLRTALAMLCEQELPRPDFRWEVLVVDNASTDETPRVVEEFRDRLPVRYVREEGRGAGHSRNCAIRSFRSDLLIFIDDDEFPAEGWLREMWNATVRWPNIEVFQGRVLPRWSSEIPRWLPMEREYQVRSPLPEIDLGESEELLDIPRFTTANAAARRGALVRAGEFRTDLGAGNPDIFLGEDAAYARQLHAAGAKGVYVPTALLHHPVDPRRVTRSYFRRWNRAMGRVRVRIAQGGPARLWGVPVHAVREYIEARIRQVYYRLIGQKGRSFALLCRAWKLEGMMYEGWVTRLKRR